MLVGVCDFPGTYAFPPHGYGGIERWLWATALGARAAGADVHLLGPDWRDDLGPEWKRHPIRLEDVGAGSTELKALRESRYDLLVVGHEYPSLSTWRETADTLSCGVATFQHSPDFHHGENAFDGIGRRLYCYSRQMADRYREHEPIQELAVHAGLDEREPASAHGEGLVWVGRVDEDKSPHLAIRAAQILGRRIRVVGPVFDSEFVHRHQRLFSADHVEWVGELGGSAKTGAFRHAEVFVYTYSRDYVEAGAAVFGEALRAGTPIAALAWSKGTCVEAALCEQTGSQVVLNPAVDDETAAQSLAQAIEEASELPHRRVQEVGLDRFDVKRHFEALARTP
ncbi:glycosyltransferase involved in cell wall biosynthesis [Nocardiopsis sp. Huas11]|uniref:glycosyltransferase n=1 Tax=Nocardiopsis sp. Huas11 TaxID=2183912 RepID=UPI000EAE28C7|nr:glycosyltransferase [Nocardiopsis sp. Huas11]RKS06012.1 glycosyltransferase involved in cell wall biosynthesis [Nocardiopsis sp. Huas11]